MASCTPTEGVNHAAPQHGTARTLYDIECTCGRGKFSTVYRATRKSDGATCALKRIKLAGIKELSVRQKCLKESQLLQSLDHPNIIQYYDSFFENESELVIALEWATAGDLKRQIRKMRDRGSLISERAIWRCFIQMCDALIHMHDRRILHRDLKPANVFLMKDGHVKIGDLGLGRLMNENTVEAFSKVGTPLYMSPETLRGDGYDWKSDVWSMGIMLYEMAALRTPFEEEGLSMYGLFKKITRGEFEPIGEPYSDELRSLSARMIYVVPGERPELREVRQLAQAALIAVDPFHARRSEQHAAATQGHSTHAAGVHDDVNMNRPRALSSDSSTKGESGGSRRSTASPQVLDNPQEHPQDPTRMHERDSGKRSKPRGVETGQPGSGSRGSSSRSSKMPLAPGLMQTDAAGQQLTDRERALIQKAYLAGLGMAGRANMNPELSASAPERNREQQQQQNHQQTQQQHHQMQMQQQQQQQQQQCSGDYASQSIHMHADDPLSMGGERRPHDTTAQLYGTSIDQERGGVGGGGGGHARMLRSVVRGHSADGGLAAEAANRGNAMNLGDFASAQFQHQIPHQFPHRAPLNAMPGMALAASGSQSNSLLVPPLKGSHSSGALRGVPHGIGEPSGSAHGRTFLGAGKLMHQGAGMDAPPVGVSSNMDVRHHGNTVGNHGYGDMPPQQARGPLAILSPVANIVGGMGSTPPTGLGHGSSGLMQRQPHSNDGGGSGGGVFQRSQSLPALRK